MSNETKNNIVPKLRFPEFKNKGMWERTSLGQLIEIKGRIGYRGYTIEDIVNKGEGAISLSPSNIVETGSLSFEKSTYISWTKYEESPEIMLEEGFTVLVKTGSTFGKTALIKKLPEKSTINPQIVVFKPTQVNSVFLFLLVSHSSIQKQINETVVGGAIPTLSQDSISKFEVLIPPDKEKKEQQKIADCFSSLDDLLTAESLKLDALKAHKKGLMQQLFPAEGETVPKLRFAEFRDSGEWGEKRLDEICEINPSIESLPEHFVYIDLESVEDGVLLHKKYINLEGAPSRAQRLLKKGDVIFQMVRPYQKNNYIFLLEDDLDYVASTGYAQLKAYQSAMYLYQYLHNQIFVDKVLAKSTGSNYPAINSTDLSQIFVVIPKPDEQQKIADCLSSLDELITAQTKKIEALKDHKKGLMQQLFPNIKDIN